MLNLDFNNAVRFSWRNSIIFILSRKEIIERTNKVGDMLRYIIIFILFLLSCSKNEKHDTKSWGTELIGVGYIGTNPDSLDKFFSYYPITTNQPGKLKKYFALKTAVTGDTISIPNLFLYPLIDEMDRSVLDQSSQFLIGKEDTLFVFSKINGEERIPSLIYFNKSPSDEFPDLLKSQHIKKSDLFGTCEVLITEKNNIKVCLSDGYSYNIDTINNEDMLFVNSYLNLAIKNRCDTISTNFKGTFSPPIFMSEELMYNDTIYTYSQEFGREPGAFILVDYFRSKLDENKLIKQTTTKSCLEYLFLDSN